MNFAATTSKNPPATAVKLSFTEKFGYGLGDTASNFVWALMMNFIMFYYTDIFGITAAAAGTMLLFARSTDGVVDFFIGAMADRTKSKWGRFRPYLVWLCVPLAVVFVLVFTTPDLSPAGKLVWAWVTYNLLMLLYSTINIPYGALSGVMTDDPLERTSLNSYRMSLAQIGGILANSTFIVLIMKLGAGNQQLGAQRTVLLFSAVATVLFLISFWTTKERIHPPAQQKTSLLQDLKNLFRNRHWIMMFAVGIINITFAVVRGSAGIYYLQRYLKLDTAGDAKYFFKCETGHAIEVFYLGQIGTYFLISGLAMVFGAMMTRFAVKLMGKKWSFITSLALVALTAIPFYFIKPDQMPLVYAFQILGMIFAGINATLFWAMVADTADFQEWKFKVRTTGVAFSATTCAQKAGMGIGAAFAGYLISYFGYDPKAADQTPEAIHGILLLVSLIPAVGLLLLSGAFTIYGLNEPICKTMREELAQRREQESASPPKS
jgi:GPH family glycoside/pentoside/hexuronide:cation symporter